MKNRDTLPADCLFFPMKLSLWFIPAVAAVVSGSWLLNVHHSAGELKSAVDDARRQIENARTTRPGRDASQSLISLANRERQPPRRSVGRHALFADLSDRIDDADGDHLEKMHAILQPKLRSMREADLLAVLDEIASLGLGAREKSALEVQVVEKLLTMNPQTVLSRFDDRVGNDEDDVGCILSEALGKWAEMDPNAAARWLDKKINEGKFASRSLDGRSDTRTEFEAALIARLLGNQNMLAMQRIRTLPGNDELTVLEQMDLVSLSPQARSAYAEIVRTLVPAPDRKGAFGYIASELFYEGGYESVQAFMDQINASPEERAEAVRAAALGKISAIVDEGKLKPGDVEEMRRWVGTQSPELLGRLTGEAIGGAFSEEGGLGFEETKNLVLKYHEKSSNDEVLVGFLSVYAGRSNPKQTRDFVQLIRDPSVRQRVEEELK